MKKIFLTLVFMMIGFPAWASNFHFESEDGKFSTNLGWRAQLRFANPGDEDLRTPSHFSDDETSNFELRRMRMKIGGHGYKPWIKYYFELDLQPSRRSNQDETNSTARLIDWRIDIQPYEVLAFRVGQWKINYNRERVDSSGKQQFVERSIVNRVFNIDRQVGVLMQGRLDKGGALDTRYYLGVFNGEGRSIDNTNENMMTMARLQWNLEGKELAWSQSDVERHKTPHMQIAVAWVGNKGECTRWSSSGCGSLDGLTQGTSNQYAIEQFVEEVAYKYNGMSVQHEYHWKEVIDNNTNITYNYDGSYSQIGYFLDHFIEAAPKELEIAFRYAFVNEPDPSNMTLENNRKEYTLGMNWFVAGHNNKITMDYSHLILNDASDARSYNDNRVRLQWDVSF